MQPDPIELLGLRVEPLWDELIQEMRHEVMDLKQVHQTKD
jgi:hypothetical protein